MQELEDLLATVILEQIKASIAGLCYVNEVKTILDSLRLGLKVNKVSEPMQSLFRPSVQPYMISWLKYDPALGN